MSLGVDARSNSLIVRAPDPLFEEVQLLVKQLDEEGLETPQATRIVSLQHTNAQAVKSALESLLGPDSVKASTTQANPTASKPSPGSNQPNADAAQEMQRRIEFFRQLQHPEMGVVPYEGHQYRIEGYDNGPRLPAPCLGEHTYEVLTDVLGIEPDEAAELLASGACG